MAHLLKNTEIAAIAEKAMLNQTENRTITRQEIALTSECRPPKSPRKNLKIRHLLHKLRYLPQLPEHIAITCPKERTINN